MLQGRVDRLSTHKLHLNPALVDQPKRLEDLRGLVYSETPKEMRTDPHEASAPWYRRTVPLAGLSLAMVIVLNIAF